MLQDYDIIKNIKNIFMPLLLIHNFESSQLSPLIHTSPPTIREWSLSINDLKQNKSIIPYFGHEDQPPSPWSGIESTEYSYDTPHNAGLCLRTIVCHIYIYTTVTWLIDWLTVTKSTMAITFLLSPTATAALTLASKFFGTFFSAKEPNWV